MARPQSFESAKIESHFSWVTWADSSNFAVTWFNRVQVCYVSVSGWFYEISFTLSYFFQTILAESYGGGVVWATLFRWQVLRNLQIWRKRRLDRLQVRTKFACNPIQAILNDFFRCKRLVSPFEILSIFRYRLLFNPNPPNPVFHDFITISPAKFVKHHYR